jgi:hypothetical protein
MLLRDSWHHLIASSLRRRICVGFLCADGGADQATAAELATAKARVAELETRIAALESQAAVQSRTRGDMTDQLADLNMAQQVRTSCQLNAAGLSAGIQQRTHRCLARIIILTGCCLCKCRKLRPRTNCIGGG